jgi:hypothetical protein
MTIETHNGILVLRDDLLVGGTKSRFLGKVLSQEYTHFVYATPAYGALQVALAAVGNKEGKKVTLFTAVRRELHPYTKKAIELGAEVVQVKYGYLNVVQAAAKKYAQEQGAYLVPFGLDTPEAVAAIAAITMDVLEEAGGVEHIWCAVGSGTLLKGIHLGTQGTNIQIHGVWVGKEPSQEIAKLDRITLYPYDKPFDKNARITPPFPSTQNYDAKAWEVCTQNHTGGRTLFWNVM